MKKYFALIFLSIFLFGCESNPNNNTSFNKKQECLKYKDELEKKYNKDYSEPNLLYLATISKVFYSPKENSCLYVIDSLTTYTNKPGANGLQKTFELYDHLTGKKLHQTDGCDGEIHCGLSTQEAENKFQEELKLYE